MTPADLAEASKATDYWNGFLGLLFILAICAGFVLVLGKNSDKNPNDKMGNGSGIT